jgi:nucleoside-diphosphate-sugar epimerase
MGLIDATSCPATEFAKLVPAYEGGMVQQQRVLITGGTGFLGQGLIRAWLGEGARVTAVSRSRQSEPAAGLTWRQGEIRTADDAESLLADTHPEIVYHLAGLANGAPDLALLEETVQSQLLSSIWMMNAVAHRPGTRIVLIGSLEEPREGLPGTRVVRSPYGVAKAAVRSYARMFHQQFGVDVVTATVMMAYGPGQEDRKIVPFSILARLRGEPLRLTSPDRKLDWVYLDDVSRALMLTGRTPGLAGTEFDLGSGELVSIREVVDTVTRLLGGREVLPPTPADAPTPAPSRAGDTATALRLLGWKSETSLEQGLLRTIEHHRARMQQPS